MRDKYLDIIKVKTWNFYTSETKLNMYSKVIYIHCSRYNDDSETERPIPKVPHDNLLAILLNKHPKEIYEYHEHQSLLENLPHEELDEEEMKIAWEEFNKEQEAKEEQTVVPPASVNEL